MQKSMLNKLCCPMDKNELHIEIYKEDETGEVLEGMMTCPDCKRYYPIIYSIPIMTPDDYRQKELEAPMLKRWGLEMDASKPETFQLASPSRVTIEK
ncbi:Trm112 family protein [Owenweeksia hongkongensis]|uniref:Trm112 family protein n=1 Tax=Owenweeksia hongkongensis TaxID=253245 RepID=UPI003A8FFF8A